MTANNYDLVSEIIRSLEQPDFSTKVNVASSLITATALALKDDRIQKLLGHIQENHSDIAVILESIRNLSSQAHDPRYESPWDAAIFGMLLVVDRVDPKSAIVAAQLVEDAPALWWAKRHSREIIAREWKHQEKEFDPVNLDIKEGIRLNFCSPRSALSIAVPRLIALLKDSSFFVAKEFESSKYFSEHVRTEEFEMLTAPAKFPPIVNSQLTTTLDTKYQMRVNEL